MSAYFEESNRSFEQTESQDSGYKLNLLDLMPTPARPGAQEQTHRADTTLELTAARPQENPGPGNDELPPRPSQQELQNMYTNAAQGRLDQTAAVLALHAFNDDPQRGLGNMRNSVNDALASRNSDYRMRVASVSNPDNDQRSMYIVLQRNGENLADIVTDIHRNGSNSQYRNRAIRLDIRPPAPSGPSA